MQKKINKIALGFFVLVFGFLFFNFVNASSGRPFGGTRIIKIQSQQVSLVELEGYTCNLMGGTTIDIRPVLGPVSYFIPGGVRSKTGTSPRVGQQIIGNYGGPTTINCEKEVVKTMSSTFGSFSITQKLTKDITLPTVTMFGTSKR